MDVRKSAISAELPESNIPATLTSSARLEVPKERNDMTVAAALEEELEDAGNEALNAVRERQRELLGALDLKK